MKKLFTLIFALVASVGTIFAESGYCGDDLIWDFQDGVLTISGTGEMWDFEYDSSIGVVISPWDNLVDRITSVVIDDGVTSIGARAFMRCYYLTSVSIPNSVTTINHRAFWECSSLTSVTIPNSVTSIGLAAFYQCSSLTEVTIPESVTTIGQGGTFQNCTALTKVQWNAKNCMIEPNSYYGSYYYPFSGDENLVEFTFGDQVESIPPYLCAELSGLQTVHLSNSVTTVGEGAFYECDNLTVPIYNSQLFVRLPKTYEGAYSIPDGIEIIYDNAFSGCSRLTSVTIPNSVTKIGSEAFYGCNSLLSVEIPNSVTEIGRSAFGLVPNIVYNGDASGAPWGARSMNGVVDGWFVYSDDSKTKLLACSTGAEGEITIPESVVYIENTAFYECKKITSLVIPNSVTSIGDWTFYGCTGLTSIEIPNSVTSIGEAAFFSCTGLTSVSLPNSVTSIGESAFLGCSNLASPVYNARLFACLPVSYSGAYTIPDGIETIVGEAIRGCDGLTSVTIPNSVTSIGGGAFYMCRNLTSLTLGNGITSIGSHVFQLCEKLLSVTIPNSVTNIDEYAFDGCKSLTSVTIPNSVTCIGEAAFDNCISLPSITIPNSVTSIKRWAFSNCKSLTSIDIPNSVTSVGTLAFQDCTGLTAITIGNSVTSIDYAAFSGCSGLKSVTCLAITPPQMGENAYIGGVFANLDCSKIPLYVPAGSIDAYKAADQWKEFTNMSPISAQKTETTDVEITTTENSVDIIWPSVADAATYELVIKDKNGNVICTLIFNSKGQLITIAFNAPSRDGAPQHTQVAGFSFTVTGLEEGTEYNLTISAKNENGQELDKKNISFHTDGAQGLEDLHADSDKPVKVLHDGQIYILRGEKVYDAQGKMVR